MSFDLSPTLLNGWKVLVVEDEFDSQIVAQTLLSRYGAEVLTADNGRIGLELAKKHRPHFIVSDLSMPEMNGWQMIEALKRDISVTNIPVIALTAHAMAHDRERAISAGFHNYLSKPLVPYTFVKDVLNLLIDIPHIAELLVQQGGNATHG